MKKCFLIICIAVVCSLLLAVFASAHPGKTDSNGGHHDKSTGDYHYHHGYSAHDHYDMDGDGDLDCPYNFDDKTNHNSSSNKTNNNSSTSEKNTENPEKKITVGKVVMALLLMIPFSMITLYLLYIIFSIICITIWWVCERCFKVRVDDSIQQSILCKLLVIGMIIAVPLEFLSWLGIL